LAIDLQNKWTLNLDREADNKLTRYTFSNAGCFIKLDGDNRRRLGIADYQSFGGYDAYQQVSLELFKRYGQTVHGLSWESFHRHQLGRVYAIWHHRKADLGLTYCAPVPLADDPQWKSLLARIPDPIAIRS
jgi:hypothetical protein